MDAITAITGVYKAIDEKISSYGFRPEFPAGTNSYEVPVIERDEALLVNYTSEKGKLRLLYSDNKIYLLTAGADASSADDSDYTRVSANLCILDEYNEKDIKSISNEMIETLDENFGKKDFFSQKNGKKPVTVSKSAAKSGAQSYDAVTFASRLCVIYPELKVNYNLNLEQYGEFLPEDFFVNYGNAPIMATIKENAPLKMRKLFNLLSDIYENGSNDVQNLIAVTVLGSIKNDPQMMQNILPFLSDSMLEPVIEINKLLARSKSANMRLENPPKYKPKKKKKRGGIMQTLMGGGGGGIQ